jgi:hypothetical protein
MKKLTTVLGAAIAGLIIMQPAVAHADSYVRHDASRDVIAIDEEGNEVKDPSRLDGDIVTSGVSHYGRKFGVSMSFSDLGRNSDFLGFLFLMRTNEHKVRSLIITAVPGQGWTASMGSRHGNVKCRNLATKVDYNGRRVSAIIPRKCLSNPRWVQVGMATIAGQEEGENFYADDALVTGALHNGLAWGPRVRKN